MANLTLMKGTSLAYIEGLINAERDRAMAAEAAIRASIKSVNIGTVEIWGGSMLPANALWAAGQAVSRSTYAALFAQWGTTFGAGDGSTTFNVIDMRDRVAVGFGDMGGSDANRVNNTGTGRGATGGSDQHWLTEGQMPQHGHHYETWTSGAGAHSHSFRGSRAYDSGPLNIWGGSFGSGQSGWETRNDSIHGVGDHAHWVAGDTWGKGGNEPHNNMQPFVALGFIIRAL